MSNETQGTGPDSGSGPSGTVTLSVAVLEDLELSKKRAGELAKKVAELEARDAEREQKAQKAAHEVYILELSKSGKLPPSLQEWAQTQSRAELDTFIKHCPAFVPATRADAPAEASVQLSEEDREASRLTGVSIKQLLEERKLELEAGRAK